VVEAKLNPPLSDITATYRASASSVLMPHGDDAISDVTISPVAEAVGSIQFMSPYNSLSTW
jgi:hypothetical protein